MVEPDRRISNHPKRDQTDKSLREEREKADFNAARKHDAADEAADEVVRVARVRADEVVQAARDNADRNEGSTASEGSNRERDKADVVLGRERTLADATMERQRSQRRRYLADFLATEREATDKDLVGERAHDDTVIAARDEFLATVSHDLRSLLGALSLNSELLLVHAPDGPLGDEMRAHAAKSQRLHARMNRLVSDLLDIASIEAGKLALLPEKVEVAKILSDTIEAFEPVAAAKQIKLEADAADLPLHARLDAGRILQVLANLVSNAIKFTAPGGKVSIRICGGKDEIQFAVSDTGSGISEDALPHVFERFHQISRDRRGLGLGLHISKCIIEAHHGKMWAESKLGEGSTFYFALPASLAA